MLNRLGADHATTIRRAARRLAEIEDLGQTSSLREIFYDLGEALADLSDPIRVLVAEMPDQHHPDDLPDADALVAVAEGLRYCANNL